LISWAGRAFISCQAGELSVGNDHSVHITGTAKDEKGNIFYVIKNSSSYKNMSLDGYNYMSKDYFLLKTISIMVHKDAIPTEIKEKCKIDK